MNSFFRNMALIGLLICSFFSKGQTVTVDFSKNKGFAYPEVFGVVIKSPSTQLESFDMLKQYGVKLVRATAPLNLILPADISLEDYKSNVNDVQNPDNWPGWNKNSDGNGDFSWAIKAAKERGMKTLLSISYCPDWLSWGSGGSKNFHRVPTDWEVNKDIYKKVFARLKDDVDMVGISNEPNFMQIDGSPYASKSSAYVDMFKYAAEGIREISQDVIIVGPEVAYSWKGPKGVLPHPENLEYISALVNDKGIPKSNLNAVTYHHYFDGVNIKMLDSITDLPIYVTEWNASSGVGHNTPKNMSGKESLAWIGSNLIELLNQGASGSCLYTHFPQKHSSKIFGTYEWDQEHHLAKPNLNMRSFALLSKALKLGDGRSQTVDTQFDKLSNAIGAINAEGQFITAVANVSDTVKRVNLQIRNLPFSGDVKIAIYESSENQSPFSPVQTQERKIVNGKVNLVIEMSAQSLQGLAITKI